MFFTSFPFDSTSDSPMYCVVCVLHPIQPLCCVSVCTGTTFHAVVGRIALVMGVAGATGGLTSAIVCGLVQVN